MVVIYGLNKQLSEFESDSNCLCPLFEKVQHGTQTMKMLFWLSYAAPQMLQNPPSCPANPQGPAACQYILAIDRRIYDREM